MKGPTIIGSIIKHIIAAVIILAVFTTKSRSQEITPKFAEHLYNSGYYKDFSLIGKFTATVKGPGALDSLNYFSGMAFHNLKYLKESTEKLSLVNPNSSFYNASRYFAAWNLLYLGELNNSLGFLEQTMPENAKENELQGMMLISSRLLGRELEAAHKLLEYSKSHPVAYGPQWERMFVHHAKLDEFKAKSPFLAGLYSSILPGAGKVYSGQKGAGISSFLTIGTLGAISLENGLKKGWTKWNSIAALGLFSVFYVGNIYGSVVGIKVYRERFNNEVDRAILLDLNIPLRNIYQ